MQVVDGFNSAPMSFRDRVLFPGGDFHLNYSVWPEPSVLESNEGEILDVNLVNASDKDILTRMAVTVSNSVQFPINTTFMHGLGVIASVMTRRFKYNYFGMEAPVNLYVVTSQPPSTGKSGVNTYFTVPARLTFKSLNDEHQDERERLEKEIEKGIKLLKSDDGSIKASTNIQMEKYKARLEEIQLFKYAVSNVTPEALESLAFKQGGVFNVISDEAGSINVLLGNVYSESRSNADIILQGWDGDYMASSRITREGSEGYVKGSIAVIAQDETIQTILEAGSRGNGISERFLLLREKNLLGSRVFSNKRVPIDKSVTEEYERLIKKLIHSDEVVFVFSDDALELVRLKKEEIEPHLADGRKYANNMLRGAMGKMDKQVMKMSCVLHVAENWGHSEGRVIDASTVSKAIKIYDELMMMYISAADSKGFIGESSEIIDIIEQFRKFLDKKKPVVTASALSSYIKGKPVFKNRQGLTKHLKNEILPLCEERGLCVLSNNTIYINPRLGS